VPLAPDRRRILHRWGRSGLSAAAFAPSVGISPWTLYAWRRQERDRADRSPAGASMVPAFVELAAAEHERNRDTLTAPRIEIALARDIVIRVEPGFDAETLRRAVDVLLLPAPG
jgi:transposase-like protein